MSKEQRFSDATQAEVPCATCAHYLGAGRCLAYDRIPSEILRGTTLHRVKLAGQIGDYIYTKAAPRKWIEIKE